MSYPVCSVLIPSRGRTASLKEAVARLLEMADSPERVEIIVRVHEDDPQTLEWAAGRDRARVHVVVGETLESYSSMSEFVNSIAAMSHGDWLWPCSDDWRVQTKGWDRLLSERLPDPRCTPMLLYSSIPDRRISIASRGLYRAVGHMGMTEHGDSYMSSLAHSGEVLGQVPIDMQDCGLGEVGPRDREKTWSEYRSPEVAWCFDLDKIKLGAILGRKYMGSWTTRNAPSKP